MGIAEDTDVPLTQQATRRDSGPWIRYQIPDDDRDGSWNVSFIYESDSW